MGKLEFAEQRLSVSPSHFHCHSGIYYQVWGSLPDHCMVSRKEGEPLGLVFVNKHVTRLKAVKGYWEVECGRGGGVCQGMKPGLK